MSKFLRVAITIVLAVAAAGWLLWSHQRSSEKSEAEMERLRVKREFAENMALARSIPIESSTEWQSEISALLRDYFAQVASLKTRFPSAPVGPTAIEATEEEKKKKLSKEESETIRDFQEYADARYAMLKEGRYNPVASSLAGGMRLDLVSQDVANAPGGGQGIRIDFALWGPPRTVDRERLRDRTVTRVVVPITFRELKINILDVAGKPIAEMSKTSEPYQKLQNPERFVSDFPPGVLFGTWWVDQFPREAVRAKFDVSMDVRGASGSTRAALFTFEGPVPESWKIPPGATFEAEVRTGQ